MTDFVTQIGEAFVGEGAEAAHLNTVLGARGGPVEIAWTTALATPRQGHTAFLVTARPGISVKPPTIFVNKAFLESPLHERLTWGAAQAGVAAGVGRAIADGDVERAAADDLLLIAAVWVSPQAKEEDLVFENNREATRLALFAGVQHAPSIDDFVDASADPFNAFFRSRT
jgi:5,6,7,8-tetrahydromethanopterin hydro-lyase